MESYGVNRYDLLETGAGTYGSTTLTKEINQHPMGKDCRRTKRIMRSATKAAHDVFWVNALNQYTRQEKWKD